MVKDKSKFLVYCLLLTSFTVGFPFFPYGLLGAEIMMFKEIAIGFLPYTLLFFCLLGVHMSLFFLLLADRNSYFYQTLLWLGPLAFVTIFGCLPAMFPTVSPLYLTTFIPFLVFWIILMVREYILYPQGDQEL